MSRRAGRMTMKLLVAAMAASTMAADTPPPAGAAADRSWDDYRILLDRNIFRRDRRARRSRTSTQPRATYTYDSDSTLVLTGIARRDGEFVAFFEDTRAKTVARVRVGDAVGKGKVERINLDEVAYAREGAVTAVGVGRNLMGTMAPILVRPLGLPDPRGLPPSSS